MKLSKTKCYTIGSMQYENGQGWRNRAKEVLNSLDITVFDPYHKPFINEIQEDEESRNLLLHFMANHTYDCVADHMKAVRSDDLRLCDLSDFFIVYINPKIPTWGSAEELATANRMKKPIFVFVEGGKTKTPLWVMGMIPHRYIYDDLDSVLTMIKRIDSGEQEIDSDRWRLLKPEYR